MKDHHTAMPESGSEHQQRVAIIARVLQPGYEVQTGHWVEGPDGEREVDVEVGGLADGKPRFVSIEWFTCSLS